MILIGYRFWLERACNLCESLNKKIEKRMDKYNKK